MISQRFGDGNWPVTGQPLCAAVLFRFEDVIILSRTQDFPKPNNALLSGKIYRKGQF